MRASIDADDKKLLFVTGKGGVGKSMIAAGIALQQARRGRKVLLVELGDASYFKEFWNLPSVGPVPAATHLGFDLALWSGETCLREYVLHFLKVERLYKLFFENKVMSSLINVAPGLAELAILGKITSGIRKIGPPLEYDLIVIDTYATGHALALLRAPKGMQEAIKFGPMGSNSREIREVLVNPSVSGYLITTLLEEMPVTETLELKEALKVELDLEAQVVANRMLSLPDRSSEIERLRSATLQGEGAAGLREFCDYLLQTSERQIRFVDRLENAGAPPAKVPLIFSERPDEIIAGVADALSEESAQ